MTHVTINTDGSCLGNQSAADSPGGFAATVEWNQDSLITITGGDPATTNNRMELAAVIEALRVLRQTPELAGAAVTVRSDSQYVTKAFNDDWIGGWKRRNWRSSSGDPVKNQDLWHELIALAEGLDINWEWVKGHSGDPGNERCDQLANQNTQGAAAQPGYWVEADAAFTHEIPPRPQSPESTPSNHDHSWSADNSRWTRLHGDVYEDPVKCECGGTAWKYNWCGRQTVTDIEEPEEPEPDPETPERDPGAEALRILEGISSLLDQCPTFESFRDRARRLMDTAKW